MDTAFHEFTHDRFIFPSGKGALVSVNASHLTKQVAFGGFCLSERRMANRQNLKKPIKPLGLSPVIEMCIYVFL
jgi:hypothetical protein